MQAVIGGLVAKTLTTSSTNPYAQGGAGARAAPVALDVFSVQVNQHLLVSLYTYVQQLGFTYTVQQLLT